MSAPKAPVNPHLVLPGGRAVPLKSTYLGRRWRWRGFQWTGGVWRRRTWGWWPIARPFEWRLEVSDTHADEVRRHPLREISAALDLLPGNTSVTINIPVAEAAA